MNVTIHGEVYRVTKPEHIDMLFEYVIERMPKWRAEESAGPMRPPLSEPSGPRVSETLR